MQNATELREMSDDFRKCLAMAAVELNKTSEELQMPGEAEIVQLPSGLLLVNP